MSPIVWESVGNTWLNRSYCCDDNSGRCLDNEIFTCAFVSSTMHHTMPHVCAREKGRACDLSHIAVLCRRFPCAENARVGFRHSTRLSPALNTEHTCSGEIR